MMERKNYLLEKLSNEEKLYLKKVVINIRRKYIRDNYEHLNNCNLELYENELTDETTVLETVILRCEDAIRNAIEFEKVISDPKLYNIVKALSLKEKMVLFALYKENKTINQIALEMKIDRTTAWRIKSKALDKIMKYIIGGNENV